MSSTTLNTIRNFTRVLEELIRSYCKEKVAYNFDDWMCECATCSKIHIRLYYAGKYTDMDKISAEFSAKFSTEERFHRPALDWLQDQNLDFVLIAYENNDQIIVFTAKDEYLVKADCFSLVEFDHAVHKLINKKSPTATKECHHEMKEYIGAVTDRFNYCAKCGKKEVEIK